MFLAPHTESFGRKQTQTMNYCWSGGICEREIATQRAESARQTGEPNYHRQPINRTENVCCRALHRKYTSNPKTLVDPRQKIYARFWDSLQVSDRLRHNQTTSNAPIQYQEICAFSRKRTNRSHSDQACKCVCVCVHQLICSQFCLQLLWFAS